MRNQNQLIAIVGGSGSGKTWLAEQLQRALGASAVRLSLDDFYRDRSSLPLPARQEINFDHPHAIDWQQFEQVLHDCRHGRPTCVPRYDFATHVRKLSGKEVLPAPFVLVEGLWLLWRPRIAKWFDLKIFLDCPAHLRLERRLMRDLSERGRSADAIYSQFWKTVVPMHDQFVAPQAGLADIILQSPPGETALRKLNEKIAMLPLAHTLETKQPVHEPIYST